MPANHSPRPGRKVIDLAGVPHGLLMPRRVVGRSHGAALWECDCACGAVVRVPSIRLRRKHRPVRSCGCLRGRPTAEKARAGAAPVAARCRELRAAGRTLPAIAAELGIARSTVANHVYGYLGRPARPSGSRSKSRRL